MKFFKKFAVTALLAVAFVAPTFSMTTETKEVSAAGTGYTKASDVNYKMTGKYIHNWGARDEDCVFLSEYAEDFYTGEYTYEVLSQKKGGTGQNNAKGTALFNALQTKMQSSHTFYTYYDGSKNVRDYYKYADCVKSDTSKVSLLYLGTMESSTWNGGSIWNQEHMWPKSKLNTSQEIGDIMQLRPANPSENSSRGNTAYGESSGYYDPNKRGQSVRGDAARMALYMYVRYGSSSMWGSGGVIESMNVLLKWMEEDPVDTWEMGRNDAVQSITGTRNVFVDYPEYAWLLFGKDIPDDMVTPSGIAEDGTGTVTPPTSSEKEDSSSSEIVKPDSSKEDSSIPDSSIESEKPDSSDKDSSVSDSSIESSEEEVCDHQFSNWITTKNPTETEEGERKRVCTLCGEGEKEIIPMLCSHTFSSWVTTKKPTETEDGERKRVCTLCGTGEKEVIPALGGGSDSSIEDSFQFDESTIQGCSASVGASMGSALFALAACVVVDKLRKRNK